MCFYLDMNYIVYLPKVHWIQETFGGSIDHILQGFKNVATNCYVQIL
jgi:hypothetical protein